MVDNASTNATCLDDLRDRQVQRFGDVLDGVILKHQNLHMRCAAHILNLIVQDGLKELDTFVVKMRMTVKHVKSFPQREDTFKNHVEAKGLQGKDFLQLDVCTRWNSTYIMLKSEDKHRAAFEEMIRVDDSLVGYMFDRRGDGARVGVPTNSDWDRIEVFISFLKVFYEATLMFSTSKTCTAHLFCRELCNLKRQLDILRKNPNEFFSGMAERMYDNYAKYWGELNEDDPTLGIYRFLFVATIEPKCKITWFEFWLPKIMSIDDNAKTIALAMKTIEELFNEYKSLYGDSSSSTRRLGVEDASSSELRITDMEDDPECIAWVHLIQNTQFNRLTELDRYLSDEPEPPIDSFTILEWWKVNKAKYPVLDRMAQNILAIPIITVSSESVFSMGGRVLSVFRSSLAPRTTEGLICAQNSLRSNIEIFIHCDDTEDQETYRLGAEMLTNPQTILEGIGEQPIWVADHSVIS